MRARGAARTTEGTVKRNGWIAAGALACVVAALVGAASVGHAGLGSLKKKLTDKAKKVEDQADQASDKAKGDDAASASSTAPRTGDSASEGGGTGAAAAGGGSIATVSTKFDFVPGDSVIFVDDLTQDELGEFPTRWTLRSGTWEVAELKGERWLRCTSTSGAVRMKVPPSLPEFWTLEFDFYGVDLGGAIALTVDARSAGGDEVWESRFPYSGHNFEFHCGDVQAQSPIDGDRIEGRHHLMYMARGNTIKAYIDRQRVASVPDISAKGVPALFEFTLGAPGQPMITNVRFAEGCRPAKDLLDTGKLVTYGIRFDTGSDVVLPESAPVLRQVSAWMGQHAEAKLRITGHTDNVGTAASNLDLSKRRAAAVAKALAGQFGIAADRFATDGRGDTQPLAPNARAEGRAMNRRVEFAKL